MAEEYMKAFIRKLSAMFSATILKLFHILLYQELRSRIYYIFTYYAYIRILLRKMNQNEPGYR